MEEAEEVQQEAEGADLCWDLVPWRLAKKKDNKAQHTASDRWNDKILMTKTLILNFQNCLKTNEKTNSGIPKLVLISDLRRWLPI